MSGFADELMDGYTKHTGHFDKWCEKASSALGNIIQCGVIELHRDGSAFIVANQPERGEQNLEKKYYLHQSNWSFDLNPVGKFFTETTQFRHEQSDVYTKKYRASWFYHRDMVGADIQQICFFASDSPVIYEKMIQSMSVIQKLLSFFKKDSQKIISYQREPDTPYV